MNAKEVTKMLSAAKTLIRANALWVGLIVPLVVLALVILIGVFKAVSAELGLPMWQGVIGGFALLGMVLSMPSFGLRLMKNKEAWLPTNAKEVGFWLFWAIPIGMALYIFVCAIAEL